MFCEKHNKNIIQLLFYEFHLLYMFVNKLAVFLPLHQIIIIFAASMLFLYIFFYEMYFNI